MQLFPGHRHREQTAPEGRLRHALADLTKHKITGLLSPDRKYIDSQTLLTHINHSEIPETRTITSEREDGKSGSTVRRQLNLHPRTALPSRGPTRRKNPSLILISTPFWPQSKGKLRIATLVRTNSSFMSGVCDILLHLFSEPACLAVKPLDLHLVNVGSIPTGPTHGEV